MTAYCETCASIANVYWNQRMFLMTGESKYYDVLERTLYNALLSGVSLSGDRFFYDNLLEDDGSYERQPWFGCACCPGNITRYMASVSGYQYATDHDGVYVNLFAGSEASIPFRNDTLQLHQITHYPWDGHVEIRINPKHPEKFSLFVRIPGWAGNEAVPSDLYAFKDDDKEPVIIRVSGSPVDYEMKNGYAQIFRKWKTGDRVEIDFPMLLHRIKANDSVVNNRNKVALQRGPLVYCLEDLDQSGGYAFSLYLPDTSEISTYYRPDLLGGIITLTLSGKSLSTPNDNLMTTNDNLMTTNDNLITTNDNILTAIPYCYWNNRGPGEMIVWIPVDSATAIPEPAPVTHPIFYGVKLDTYNTMTFDPVTTLSLRIEARLQEGYSAGILEWKVF